MAKTIKGITVEIEGNATGLGKALEDVNKSIKSTNSELNKVDKALKLDPENTVLLTQKQELLSEAIKETSEKLKTLENVQEEVERQFQSGEIGAEAYRDFQRTVETTKSKLKSLNEESENLKLADNIKEAGNETEETTSETKKLENALGKVATAAERTAKATAKITVKVGTEAVSAAANVFEKYTKTLTVTATALAGVTVKAAMAADDINTLSTQTGLSTEQIQKFSYASDLIDVDLDTLTGSMAKLTKNMASAQDGTGTAAEAFEALGISITDSNGELRNNQDVFNEAIEALSNIENETQRDAYAMQIFGKSAQELNPLIEGGTEALEALGNSAEEAGLILSQAALDDLNAFNDSIDILKANASSCGNILAGAFVGKLKKATDLIGNSLPNLATSFAGMFSAETFEKSSEDFSNNIVTLFTGITDMLAENLPEFVNGFNGLILGIADGIVATLPTVTEQILPTLLTGCTNLVTGLVSHLPTLLPTLAQGAVTLFVGLIDGLNEVIEQLTPMLPDIVQDITTVLIDNMPLLIDGTVTLFTGIIEGLSGALPEILQAVADLAGAILVELAMHLPDIIAAGADMVVAIAKGLVQLFSPISDALSDIILDITSFFSNAWQKFKDIGSNILNGIADGIKNGASELWDSIYSTCDDIYNSFCDFFGIHSPSRLFRDNVGVNLAAGIGVGFENEMSHVNAQIQKSLPTSFDTSVNVNANGGVSGAISSAGQALSMANLPQNATFIIQMDGKTCAESTFPYINIMAGAKIKLDNRGLA